MAIILRYNRNFKNQNLEKQNQKRNFEKRIMITWQKSTSYFKSNAKIFFDDSFEVDTILKNISFKNRDLKFVSGKQYSFLQDCINWPKCLKSFKLDGRFNVICSESLIGFNYKEIESVSVGYKEDYQMFSLDFEEFLQAKGFIEEQVNNL